MRRIISVLAIVCALGLQAAAVQADEGTDARKLDSVLGREVTSTQDGIGGRIVDILVDNDGRLRAAVVEFGGFLGIGTRKIAVEWSAFRFTGRTIEVDVSRDQLRAAPEFKSNAPTVITKATPN
jgi:hypothetical protein